MTDERQNLMRLEDVKAWTQDEGNIWLQSEAVRLVPVFIEESTDLITYFVGLPFVQFKAWLPNEEYGKTWRCWRNKPTDDELDNTPWENGVNEEETENA